MDKLNYISWINKNSIFDKSIGKFKEIDFFTFLENLSSFDYKDKTIYDDFYYILYFTQDAILYLIQNLNKEIKRTHQIMPISKAKEFDKESTLWISKKPGRSLSEKLFDGKVKAVKRYENIDTYENRLLKKFLKKILYHFENRDDLNEFEIFIYKIRKFLRSDEANSIDEYKKIIYNNILLHHKHYKKIFKAYKWLNYLEEKYKSINVDLNKVLKYELFYQMQFFTKELIYPDILNIDYEKYIIEDKKLDIVLDKDFEFENIRDKAKEFLKEKMNENRLFVKRFENKDIFIDIFRLYPIAKVDDEIINFPIFLKQKINNKIVNANNTKVIDLNKEFFTLTEILSTYDINIFKYFLDDLNKYFIDSNIYYIVPDFVDEFEFSKIKKLFNSYYKTKVVPKSVLAGLEYIFNNKTKKNDTLIYVQRGSDNYLYITPLLVKKEKTLFLQRHPTKRLKESKELLKELQKYFNKELANTIFSKFLQNGIKKAKDEITFVFNKQINIQDINIPKTSQKDINEIKGLYQNKKLFQNCIFITDNNEKNLLNYQKLIEFEKKGQILWKDHLPKLSMQIVKDGYFDEFILVDDSMELVGNKLEIKNNFIIPANIKELSFPLILEDKNIDYEAYISSSQMPFSKDVECKLELTYDYEAENIYNLIFIPLDKKYQPLYVKWQEIKYNDNLAYPDYPKKKIEVLNKSQIGNKSNNYNIIEWLVDYLKLNDNNIPLYYIKKDIDKLLRFYTNYKKGKFIFGKNDKNGKYFCFINIDGKKVFCHSQYFTDKNIIDKLYENIEVYTNLIKQDDKFIGKDLRLDLPTKNDIEKEVIDKLKRNKYDFIIKIVRIIEFPLLNLLNNRDIRQINNKKLFQYIKIYIQIIENYMSKKNINLKYKKDFLLFLSIVNTEIPQSLNKEFIKILNLNDFSDYKRHLAFLLGKCQTKLQQNVFNNIFKKLQQQSNDVLYILSIASWRNEDFIYYDKIINNIKQILFTLLNLLKYKVKENKNIAKEIELLLAIIRLRSKYPSLLHPKDDITKEFIKIVDKVTKKIIQKNLKFNSRVEIKVNKPKGFEKTPNLLYALRLYLSGDSGANSIKITGVKED